MEDPSYQVRLHTTVVRALLMISAAWYRPEHRAVYDQLQEAVRPWSPEQDDATTTVTMTLDMWNVLLGVVEVIMGPDVWATIKDQLPE